MSTLITTPVAQFTIDHMAARFEAGRFPVEAWTRMYAKSYPEYRVEAWSGKAGKGYFGTGPLGITPRIWTHTPVPMGMNIEAVHKRFEERAASVLSDYEEPTDLSPDPSYADGRYRDITVRTAWMMYLDLAIEHFLTQVYH